jgi:hypothetical protein
MVAQACSPSTGKDHLSTQAQDEPAQHRKTLSLKNIKIKALLAVTAVPICIFFLAEPVSFESL